MTIAALLLAIAALAWGILTQRRVNHLREDIRYIHRTTRTALEDQEIALREFRAEATQKIDALRDSSAPAGKPSWFTPYMTIADALGVHPGVKGVLASLHIGGCAGCSSSSTETLEQAARGHGVDLNTMLERMNALMEAENAAPNLLAMAEKSLPLAVGGRVMVGMAGSSKDA